MRGQHHRRNHDPGLGALHQLDESGVDGFAVARGEIPADPELGDRGSSAVTCAGAFDLPGGPQRV
jgi:hypothetical protein